MSTHSNIVVLPRQFNHSYSQVTREIDKPKGVHCWDLLYWGWASLHQISQERLNNWVFRFRWKKWSCFI